MRLGLVGYGSIVSLALETIATRLREPLEAIVVLARPTGADRARDLLDRIDGLARERHVVVDVSELLSHAPDLVCEAAGHEALRSAGPATLAAGVDLLVTSAGALSDAALRASLNEAARKGSSRFDIIPGAVGGLDILAAAALSGVENITYTSRKPPRAWRGTKAEALLDLDALEKATVFFEGRADDAARDFPQNANVAATVALYGAGFERTRVQLIADPAVSRNVHEVSMQAACADFTIRIEGRAAPDNPKTSLTTAYSLAERILARIG